MIIIIDSWAWIEYFAGSAYGSIVREYLSDEYTVFTPNVVLLEIAGKYAREGFDEKETLKRLLFILKKSDILEFDHELAVKAGKCLLELRENAKRLRLKKEPGIVDGLLLAMARKLKGKILTGDEHFKDLKEAIFIKETS